MKWGPQWVCIERAFRHRGLNPKTGRPCKLHECEGCHGLFAKKDIKADHKIPVVDPHDGFQNWDEFIARLFVEAHGYQALCKKCHDEKTELEGQIRRGKLSFRKAVRSRNLNERSKKVK